MIILKLVAWSDRPEVRDNDLEDILRIIEKYYDLELNDIIENHADTWPPEDKPFDNLMIAAEVLGRKSRSYLNKSEKLAARITKVLEENLTDSTKSEIAIAWARKKGWEIEYASSILASFRKGLSHIQPIQFSLQIHSTPGRVWEALTQQDILQKWMAEPEIGLEIETDWQPGQSIITRGFHHVKFENKGTVLEFIPQKVLKYNYLSSVSRLPNLPENHTVLEFRLNPVENGTQLTLILNNFPTESIFKHVELYWKTSLQILRELLETEQTS
ncbi:MAG: SRPBCC domain-containing protein [Bacteroidia bacterium]|nr:SRPBCC domain-containing protein [Bacteroidia bacterium]